MNKLSTAYIIEQNDSKRICYYLRRMHMQKTRIHNSLLKLVCWFKGYGYL